MFMVQGKLKELAVKRWLSISFNYLVVCFTSYFVFSIAVLPYSPGVVYYQVERPEFRGLPPSLFK